MAYQTLDGYLIPNPVYTNMNFKLLVFGNFISKWVTAYLEVHN